MDEPNWKRWGRRVGALVLASGLALIAAEWGVQRLFPVGGLLFQPDDELLFTTVPGARGMVILSARSGGGRAITAINAQGFRGPLPEQDKPGRRIAVYGDSFVLAENVALADTFVERLRDKLATTPVPAEVINAGVTGYGPDQAYLRFVRQAEELQPDGLLFVVCASNDFGDLLRNKLFAVDADGELARRSPRLAQRMRQHFADARQRAARPALQRAFETWRERRVAERLEREHDQSALPYIDWYLEAAVQESADARSGNAEVFNLFQDVYDADVAIRPDSSSARHKVALMRAVLARLRDECATRGVDLLVLIVPSAVDLCPGFDVRVDPGRWPNYDPRRLTDTLAGLCEELGVEAFDLFEAFSEGDPEALFVGGSDVHWNAAGQALAARLVAGRLSEN